MRPMGKTSDSKSRRVTPPSPSYMSNDQFASYLSELRSNRMSRPGGARPQPSGARPAPDRASTSRHSLDIASQAGSQTSGVAHSVKASSQAPSIGAGSVSSRYSRSSMSGRDYDPSKSTATVRPSEVVSTATYMERGQRWMEKEEVHSLRDAMDELDIRRASKDDGQDGDDSRIYNAALDEASELVWQHQNPELTRQPDGPYRYRPHLRKNSYVHARAASAGRHGEAGSRSVSGSSSGSDGCSRRSRPSMDSSRLQSKPYGSIGSRSGAQAAPHRRSSMKRNINGEVDRPFSGDQIWEEPESGSTRGTVKTGRASPEKLGSKPQNPLNRVHFQDSREEVAASKPHNRVEIHRNPPSRSRDAQYVSNPDMSPVAVDDGVARKDGVEVRSQDIRDATSMRMSDRSPRLPEPTAVSDSPGRPIVSFNADWRAPNESTDTNPEREAAKSSPSRSRFHSTVQPTPQPKHMDIPSISMEEDVSPRPRSAASPSVPSINIAGPGAISPRPLPSISVPTIAVEETSGSVNSNVPTIALPSEDISTKGKDTAGNGGHRYNYSQHRQPRRQQQTAQRPAHWSRAPGAANKGLTICHECGYPIEGRFVALAGTSERFHPRCLACYTCGTSLEAMEISPEPDQVRSERLERICRRAAGEILDETPGMTMAEDGDDRLRFYCHLDWHERFAPRCKNCKTPILGEHIVALGQHWHYGHFFCAECGDPFEQGMTHIEKDGYAWCIKCQTKRTERRAPKCRTCRAAVIGEYIQALGGEWHEHCFRCAECQGSFVDGQIFPKDLPGGIMVVLCTPCRARELKG